MERVITARSIFGVVTAASYIITKILAIGIGIVWFGVEYLALGKVGGIVAAVVVALPCIWLSVIVARMAYDAETAPENNVY
jgi:hypothetical protein